MEEDTPCSGPPFPSNTVDVTIGVRPFAEKAWIKLRSVHGLDGPSGTPRLNISARRRTPGTRQAAWREMVATSGFHGVGCILLIGCPLLPAAQDPSKLEFRESHRPHHRQLQRLPRTWLSILILLSGVVWMQLRAPNLTSCPNLDRCIRCRS